MYNSCGIVFPPLSVYCAKSQSKSAVGRPTKFNNYDNIIAPSISCTLTSLRVSSNCGCHSCIWFSTSGMFYLIHTLPPPRPTSVANTAFYWPRLSTAPTAGYLLSAHAHSLA